MPEMEDLVPVVDRDWKIIIIVSIISIAIKIITCQIDIAIN